jgi:hypothetical protein
MNLSDTMKWLTAAALLVILCVQLRRWIHKRKGIAYEPITRLKL